MKAIRLRTEHMCGPLGIDAKHPMLSWCCEDGIYQTAFQIVAGRGEDMLWNSGICKSSQMHCRYEQPLHSRERITWKVRLWDEQNEPGPWSEEAVFELGITDHAQWNAKWIDPDVFIAVYRSRQFTYSA